MKKTPIILILILVLLGAAFVYISNTKVTPQQNEAEHPVALEAQTIDN